MTLENIMELLRMTKTDRKVVISLLIIIVISSLVTLLSGCKSNNYSQEIPLDLSDIVETGYGNTVDGDSMYWAIHEDWHNDCKRSLIYMDKETFDSLESAVDRFHKADIIHRDSLNIRHNFTLLRDSEGLHLRSIR